jgi:L-amino acid N-acyltransferase YncA
MLKSFAMSTPSARPQLHIRNAQESDSPAICEIFNEAVSDRLETFDCSPRAMDDQRQLVAAADNDPKHPILVAEVRNWIAGWASLSPYDPRIALDDIGEVAVYVRRQFRNYGIGQQLVRSVQEAAAKLGYRKLIARTLVTNHDALRLCQATGWREVGRHTAHARWNDELIDVILLEQHIAPATAST